ncbi:MAG: nucleotidyltransferase family protein [Phycisphaerae bacterium]
MSTRMDKAVIMARGLGTRMRKADDHARLSAEQSRAADKGLKLLIPVAGGTFLDYVLAALADAGYKEICLIIGPEHVETRDYFGNLKTSRIRISFAVQEKPLGTANAVLAAEEFAGGDPFLVINSDNYYPPESLAALRDLDGPGLAGFEKQSMLKGSNIPADRIAKFAVIQIDGDGQMVKIIEKPAPEVLAAMPEPIYLSMNCWRFDRSIFEACRNIKPSPRNEYEIPDAVTYSMEKLGRRYRVANIHAPVLDLSSRSDVEGVVAKMKGMEINL